MTLHGMASRNFLLLFHILTRAMYIDHTWEFWRWFINKLKIGGKEHEESRFSFFGKENLWKNREYILKCLLLLYQVRDTGTKNLLKFYIFSYLCIQRVKIFLNITSSLFSICYQITFAVRNIWPAKINVQISYSNGVDINLLRVHDTKFKQT